MHVNYCTVISNTQFYSGNIQLNISGQTGDSILQESRRRNSCSTKQLSYRMKQYTALIHIHAGIWQTYSLYSNLLQMVMSRYKLVLSCHWWQAQQSKSHCSDKDHHLGRPVSHRTVQCTPLDTYM